MAAGFVWRQAVCEHEFTTRALLRLGEGESCSGSVIVWFRREMIGCYPVSPATASDTLGSGWIHGSTWHFRTRCITLECYLTQVMAPLLP